MVLTRRLVTLLRHPVQNKGIFAEHLTVSNGAPVFRVTPVEKHCSSLVKSFNVRFQDIKSKQTGA